MRGNENGLFWERIGIKALSAGSWIVSTILTGVLLTSIYGQTPFWMSIAVTLSIMFNSLEIVSFRVGVHTLKKGGFILIFVSLAMALLSVVSTAGSIESSFLNQEATEETQVFLQDMFDAKMRMAENFQQTIDAQQDLNQVTRSARTLESGLEVIASMDSTAKQLTGLSEKKNVSINYAAFASISEIFNIPIEKAARLFGRFLAILLEMAVLIFSLLDILFSKPAVKKENNPVPVKEKILPKIKKVRESGVDISKMEKTEAVFYLLDKLGMTSNQQIGNKVGYSRVTVWELRNRRSAIRAAINQGINDLDLIAEKVFEQTGKRCSKEYLENFIKYC